MTNHNNYMITQSLQMQNGKSVHLQKRVHW